MSTFSVALATQGLQERIYLTWSQKGKLQLSHCLNPTPAPPTAPYLLAVNPQEFHATPQSRGQAGRPPQLACVMGRGSIPGCLPSPGFIREKMGAQSCWAGWAVGVPAAQLSAGWGWEPWVREHGGDA